jgi:hypothetical protein
MEVPDSDSEAASDGGAVRDRQCGRCQLTFPGDAGSHPTAQLGWWLCPPCKDALIDHQPPSRS